MIESMPEHDRGQVSADWLAQLRSSREPDPWTHTFQIKHRANSTVLGTCGFKGPPVVGIVELAYGVSPDHQGNGYATEAAMRLVEFAFSQPNVCLIKAHTLPGAEASQRVLTKCGFRHVGDAIDPDDGPVARFERGVGDDASAR